MKPGVWAEIHRLKEFEHLSGRAIAKRLHCGTRTVRNALESQDPPSQLRKARESLLDPYKPQVIQLVSKYHDISAVRVLEEIKKLGYSGEVSLLRKYLREVRPSRGRVYQEVQYAPGEAMQVDWGDCGRVLVGSTSRKVYVFVAVLCFSRLIYIEFALSQAKAMFYRAVVRALGFFGGCPDKIIVDNLKAAVLEGSGRTARFHPEFEALCAYHRRMRPIACERQDPESKGVVEAGVKYVKKNALSGRKEELESFEDYQKLAEYWPQKIANVRNHETTDQRPIDLFEKEREHLRALPAIPYDTDEKILAIVTPHARVHFDTNRYSVPPKYARKSVVLCASDLEVRILHAAEEIARHRRSFQKHQLIVTPEHRIAALALRTRPSPRDLQEQFDALGEGAKAFRLALSQSPLKPRVHLKRLLELARVYGKTEVLSAIEKAFHFQACDAAYVENILGQQRRRRGLPSPIPVSPKRKELVEEVTLQDPDPGDYDRFVL